MQSFLRVIILQIYPKMKKLFFVLSMVSAALLFTACEPESNGGDDPNTSDTTATETVKLLLTVDKSAINLDNQELATFTVSYDGEDVTDEADIINITDGGFDILSTNTFTTFRPGEHTFYATWDKYSSDDVVIEALTDSDFSNIYYRRNLFMKFTATWCSYCPAMTTCIEQVQGMYPDRIVELAMHSSDELSTDITDKYVSTFGVAGFPTGLIDMNNNFMTTSRSATQFYSWALQSLEENPTAAGIKMSVEAEGVSKLTIDTEVTVAEDGNYKIIVACIQSGFQYSQTGTNDANYTQDHVLRAMLQQNTYGDMLNADGSVQGELFAKTYEANLTGCTEDDIANMAVLVIVLNEYSPGVYYVNNVQECAVGESKDYEYERYDQ